MNETMIFNDETDDIMDEMAIARRMLARKDQMDLANEYIKATICETYPGFEDRNIGNLIGLRDSLWIEGFTMVLVLGRDEPEITICKQGRKRKRWIDRR